MIAPLNALVSGSLCAACISTVVAAAPERAIPLTRVAIGMEGRVLYRYSGGSLRAKVATDKAPVVARIVSSVPDGAATLYDIRFIPQFAGRPDLRDALERIDGAMFDGPAAIVEVTSALPLDHNGILAFASKFNLPSLGGYRLTLIGLGVLWAVPVGVLIIRRVRNRKVLTVVIPAPPAPLTFADQLRPLVVSALQGRATVEEKAYLERLLIAHWREKLALGAVPAAAALVDIRRDAQAGELLGAVEEWFHRRAATANVSEHVARLLQPYAAAPAVAAAPPETTA